MTIIDVFNDHAQRVAEVTFWYAQGWISHQERIRYLSYETETSKDLYDQAVEEARY
jgi:hypothetical protein